MTEESSVLDELSTIFARMSGLLLSRETVHGALELVTALASETIRDAAGAGVSLLDEQGRRTTAAASDPIVERADAIQYELEEGPCLTAWAQGVVVRVDDTATEQRWPRWTAAAAPLGLHSVLSAPLTTADRTMGAIKVYANQVGAFEAREERLLDLFAQQAAVLLANMQSYDAAHRLSDQLKEALQSRDTIGQAKGILMGRDNIDADTAFAMLVAISQREHRKLRDVAVEVVESAARRRR
jgi:GAF domain-containing protein